MRVAGDSGFTLVELLVSMTISLLLLGSVLTAFNAFSDNAATASQRDQALETTRLAIDRVARQLRNLATPTSAEASIDRATPYDLVFRTADPVKRRVRYCLAPSTGGVNDVLWFQTTASGAPMTTAMTATCPGSGWMSQTAVADRIVNRLDAADRAVFGFGCSSRTPAGQSCTSSSDLYPRVLSVRADLYVDLNGSGRIPSATRMSTAVYLRNQNEPPTAAAAAAAAVGARTVLLNGSASDDPEGRTMQYQWFKGTATLPAPTCAGGPADQGAIGDGVTLTYSFPPTDTGAQQIRLRVVDPGCLYAVTSTMTVAIP